MADQLRSQLRALDVDPDRNKNSRDLVGADAL